MWKPKLKIEDFELGRALGTGTVGEIFSAIQLGTSRTVAIKILQETVSDDPLIRSRFEREIVILERLRHPNIIAVYGSGITNRRLFYAMEYVDAGSVKELLVKYGRLPWPEVAAIARQVCSALQYAHNHGIIHRDLKPANLFLTKEGQVKLGDFGIARDLRSSDLTDQGLTVGTHAYMSPEQITADSRISGKADLYSLGCVLFEMLVGRPPFQGVNFAQLFEQQLRTPAARVSTLVSDVPKAMDDVVNSLLAKSPDDRPFNARAVQGIMIEMLEDEQTKLLSKRSLAKSTASVLQSSSTNTSGIEQGTVDPKAGIGESCRIDIGADQAIDVGREQLSKRLAQSVHDTKRTLIAMGVLLIIVGLIFWTVIRR